MTKEKKTMEEYENEKKRIKSHKEFKLETKDSDECGSLCVEVEI